MEDLEERIVDLPENIVFFTNTSEGKIPLVDEPGHDSSNDETYFRDIEIHYVDRTYPSLIKKELPASLYEHLINEIV